MEIGDKAARTNNQQLKLLTDIELETATGHVLSEFAFEKLPPSIRIATSMKCMQIQLMNAPQADVNRIALHDTLITMQNNKMSLQLSLTMGIEQLKQKYVDKKLPRINMIHLDEKKRLLQVESQLQKRLKTHEEYISVSKKYDEAKTRVIELEIRMSDQSVEYARKQAEVLEGHRDSLMQLERLVKKLEKQLKSLNDENERLVKELEDSKSKSHLTTVYTKYPVLHIWPDDNFRGQPLHDSSHMVQHTNGYLSSPENMYVVFHGADDQLRPDDPRTVVDEESSVTVNNIQRAVDSAKLRKFMGWLLRNMGGAPSIPIFGNAQKELQQFSEEVKQASTERGIEGVKEHYNRQSDEWKSVPINIAVVGQAGVGKSGFINTIRGLMSSDEGGAKVGVTETTLDPKPYKFPNNDLMILWDLPGMGTDKLSRKDYLDQIDVDKYDCFLILTGSRFYEIDAWLGQELVLKKKTCYFVRTKIDNDITECEHESGIASNETLVTDEIQSVLIKEMNDAGICGKLFSIDNFKRDKFDFKMLENAIIQNLPQCQRVAAILSMSAISQEVIKAKAKELHKRSWYAAIASSLANKVQIPGISISFDDSILGSEVKFYNQQLGLDDKSLQERAKLMSVDLKLLKEVVYREIPEFNFQYMTSLINDAAYVERLADACLRIEPVQSSFVGPSEISFIATHNVLEQMLDNMERVSLELTELCSFGNDVKSSNTQNGYDSKLQSHLGRPSVAGALFDMGVCRDLHISPDDNFQSQPLQDSSHVVQHSIRLTSEPFVVFYNTDRKGWTVVNPERSLPVNYILSAVDPLKLRMFIGWLQRQDWAWEIYDGNNVLNVAFEDIAREEVLQKIRDCELAAIPNLCVRLIETRDETSTLAINTIGNGIVRRAKRDIGSKD